MQPQIEPQIEPRFNPQITNTPNNQSPSIISKFIPIISLIIAIISLVISIAGIIINNSKTVSSAESETEIESAGTLENISSHVTCNLPQSIEDISYLYINYNNGKTGIFISPDGAIDYYTREPNTTSDDVSINKGVKTDTSDIFKQLLQNGINEFTDYEKENVSEEEDGETVEWNWLAQIDNSDSSSCEAKGSGTPPTWFTNLTNLIDRKINQ
ncbi:hypothetical protein IKD82_01885 [Candidatus Saccharibacteria bacterium]|nr:hypothetical protein [Candidatus Saccharibacteria bacterium]